MNRRLLIFFFLPLLYNSVLAADFFTAFYSFPFGTSEIELFPSERNDTLEQWQAGMVVSEAAVKRYGEARCFQILPVSDAVFARMRGKSYKQNCTIARSSLRYLHLLHRNAEGRPQLGEMVCDAAIAADLVAIFRELYQKGYRIERMVLVDEYGADDERSMTANNTTCFNYRTITGSKRLSYHSRGRAVDINPLYNPMVRTHSDGTRSVSPKRGKRYADRSLDFRYKISRTDLCYRLFTARGFRWGGAWKQSKDYQHFEK